MLTLRTAFTPNVDRIYFVSSFMIVIYITIIKKVFDCYITYDHASGWSLSG